MRNEIKVLCFFFLSFLAVSCGLEDPLFSEPVDSSGVTRVSNYQASFNLPDNDDDNSGGTVRLSFLSSDIPNISVSGISPGDFFNKYNIYYKIYVSSSNNLSPDESTYSDINTQWNSDYNNLKPLTVATETSMVNSRFMNDRKYFRVNGSSGPPLLRAGELINPKPDLNFFYSSDLIDPAYISTSSAVNTNYNADVMANSSGGNSYAWTAMYIVHKKFSAALTEYYSTPTFLGIFLLPNTVNTQTISVSSVSQVGGSTSSLTSAIRFTLSQAVSGLNGGPRGSASNVMINDGSPPSGLDVSTAATALSNSGTTYTLQVTNGITTTPNLFTRNTVTLLFSRSGYSFNPPNYVLDGDYGVYVHPVPHDANNPYPVNFVSATASQSAGNTEIVLEFKPPVYGLTATDFLIDSVPFTGSISGGGSSYTLSMPAPASGTYHVSIDINYSDIFDLMTQSFTVP
jgi:hypothetical protein